MAFDKHMNIVLGDWLVVVSSIVAEIMYTDCQYLHSDEIRLTPGGKDKEPVEERRTLGMMLLRGNQVGLHSYFLFPVSCNARGNDTLLTFFYNC